MTLDRRSIRRAFSRAAGVYARHARVQATVAERLLERLDGLKFEPQRILDLGAGPGHQARALAERFPAARVVAMDAALPMMTAAGRQRGRFRKRFERVVADARELPLARASVDLLYSSLMLQWIDDLPAVLNGFRRVMKPGGLLMISTFGPDTLQELREAWRNADDRVHTSGFADVQTVGDALIRAGFGEPVLDTDWITAEYASVDRLMAELKAIGATNARSERHRGLTGKGRMRAMREAYEAFRTAEGRYPATWEVVYATAWAPAEGAPIRSFHGEEASIPVEHIGRRQR